jgi:hypothetical protein
MSQLRVPAAQCPAKGGTHGPRLGESERIRPDANANPSEFVG